MFEILWRVIGEANDGEVIYTLIEADSGLEAWELAPEHPEIKGRSATLLGWRAA